MAQNTYDSTVDKTVESNSVENNTNNLGSNFDSSIAPMEQSSLSDYCNSSEASKISSECDVDTPSKRTSVNFVDVSSSEENGSLIVDIKDKSNCNLSEQVYTCLVQENNSVPFNNTDNSSFESASVNSSEMPMEESVFICQTSDKMKNQDVAQTVVLNCSQDCLIAQKQELNKILDYVKELESKNSSLESEMCGLKKKLNNQDIVFKKAELQIRAEFLTNIEKLSKECNTLRKEKESIVVRYANSEKEVIMEKKVQQELEKRIKDMTKEREYQLLKFKGLTSENNRIASCYESKMVEMAKLQKNYDKINADFNSREIRIKWLQNKLKTETGAHQETQTKLDHTVHRLNEMKEEAEQVRKDCQEMIKCYQEAEEIKSVKLDGQLKQKLSELEVQKQEKSDQEQVYQLLRQELEALKKKQRVTMEENNSLTSKIHSLEKDRLEYEQNLSKLKDSQNMLKQEIVDLTARLAEMETLRLQLEREKEKSAASLREVERLRSTNAELQCDMNACHVKEGELLKFTEGVTDTNVKLQSAQSLLEIKAQALEDELAETKRNLADLQQKHLQLVSEFESSRTEHEDEVQLLARKLAEKTKNVEKLNTKLDEAENENRVLKRRHIASIKELSRELCECKKRLDTFDSSNGIRTAESVSLGSRSSSTASLDVVNSNESRINSISSPSIPTCYNVKSTPNSPPQNTSPEIPGIDKEMLIERIIKLQKTLARKNDKIDFLEDHIVQLVKEMRKKSKVVDFKTV